MHCHIELHNLGGMAMMFNEAPGNRDKLLGDIAQPESFPVCRNYPSSNLNTGECIRQYWILPRHKHRNSHRF